MSDRLSVRLRQRKETIISSKGRKLREESEHLSSLVDGSHSSGRGDLGVALGNNNAFTFLSLFTTNFVI